MLAELGGTDGDRVLALLFSLERGGLGGEPVLGGNGGTFSPAAQATFITLSFCLRLTWLTSGNTPGKAGNAG